MTALDINAAAVENTRRNAARHGVANQVRVLRNNLFTALEIDERFDMIFWNPTSSRHRLILSIRRTFTILSLIRSTEHIARSCVSTAVPRRTGSPTSSASTVRTTVVALTDDLERAGLLKRLKENSGDDAVAISKDKVRDTDQVFVKQLQQLLHDLQQRTDFYQRGWSSYDEALERVQAFKHYVERQEKMATATNHAKIEALFAEHGINY